MWRTMFLFILPLSVFAADPCPEPPGDHRIDGTWKLIKLEMGGGKGGDLGVPQKKVRFDKGKVIMPDEQGKSGGTYTLDGKKQPKEIDMVSEQGTTSKGIYKIEKSKLVICVALKGERPTDFAPANGIIMTLEKVQGGTD